MPVLTPYMISRAAIFSSSMERQRRMRSRAGIEGDRVAVAGDAHQALDRQMAAVQGDRHR